MDTVALKYRNLIISNQLTLNQLLTLIKYLINFMADYLLEEIFAQISGTSNNSSYPNIVRYLVDTEKCLYHMKAILEMSTNEA